MISCLSCNSLDNIWHAITYGLQGAPPLEKSPAGPPCSLWPPCPLWQKEKETTPESREDVVEDLTPRHLTDTKSKCRRCGRRGWWKSPSPPDTWRTRCPNASDATGGRAYRWPLPLSLEERRGGALWGEVTVEAHMAAWGRGRLQGGFYFQRNPLLRERVRGARVRSGGISELQKVMTPSWNESRQRESVV